MILGASFDTPAENRAFALEHSFGYRLLSDVDRSIGTAYEALRPAEDPYPDFPRRVAYLIDPDGIIRKSYEVSDIPVHPGEVFADLRELQNA